MKGLFCMIVHYVLVISSCLVSFCVVTSRNDSRSIIKSSAQSRLWLAGISNSFGRNGSLVLLRVALLLLCPIQYYTVFTLLVTLSHMRIDSCDRHWVHAHSEKMGHRYFCSTVYLLFILPLRLLHHWENQTVLLHRRCLQYAHDHYFAVFCCSSSHHYFMLSCHLFIVERTRLAHSQ